MGVKASARLLTNALKKTLSAFDLPDQGSGVYTRTSYNKEVKHRGDKSKTEAELDRRQSWRSGGWLDTRISRED